MKFLSTFANFAVALSPMAKGVNERTPLIGIYTLVVGVANTDTLTVTVPAQTRDLVPCSATLWNITNGNLIACTITSHVKTTGVTVITAGGTADLNSELRIVYA